MPTPVSVKVSRIFFFRGQAFGAHAQAAPAAHGLDGIHEQVDV